MDKSFKKRHAGGDLARSCEGRPVPSLHPPLPWPTLLFSRRQKHISYNKYHIPLFTTRFFFSLQKKHLEKIGGQNMGVGAGQSEKAKDPPANQRVFAAGRARFELAIGLSPIRP